ncbi:hypothetical protein D9M71_204950 [compost metagenome]
MNRERRLAGRHGVFRQVAGFQPALDRGLREQAVVQRDVVLQLVEAQLRARTGDEVLGFAEGNAVDLVDGFSLQGAHLLEHHTFYIEEVLAQHQ